MEFCNFCWWHSKCENLGVNPGRGGCEYELLILIPASTCPKSLRLRRSAKLYGRAWVEKFYVIGFFLWQEYYEYKTSIQTAESFTKRGEMDISFCLTITESEAEREKLGALKLLNDFYQSVRDSSCMVMIVQSRNECIYRFVCPLCGPVSFPSHGGIFQGTFPWLITLCSMGSNPGHDGPGILVAKMSSSHSS